MRSTQRSESMHAFYGGYLHCKSGLVQFVHEYDNVLGTKEQKELEDDAADSKGVIPCIGSTGIERQLQQENTSSIFRTLQLEVRKKTDCVVRSIEQKEDTISITMDEQKVFWGKPVYHTLRVDFELLSRKELTQYRTAMFFFDGIRMSSASTLTSRVAMTWLEVMKATTCSGIYVQSFITLQEFVACDEEAAILRAALWDAKSKLTDYRASMRSTTIVASQNTVPTQSTGGAIVHDIQGPS
ncbi:Transposon protein [Arachis hypogaea]|nr:Transposon protein [Arachis hypogaea]